MWLITRWLGQYFSSFVCLFVKSCRKRRVYWTRDNIYSATRHLSVGLDLLMDFNGMSNWIDWILWRDLSDLFDDVFTLCRWFVRVCVDVGRNGTSQRVNFTGSSVGLVGLVVCLSRLLAAYQLAVVRHFEMQTISSIGCRGEKWEDQIITAKIR